MNELIQPIVKPLENLFKKAPVLPAGGREFLVTVAPWFSLIFGVLSVVGSLSAFGLGAMYSPVFTAAGASPIFLMIIGVVGLVQGVLMILAFPSLRKKLIKGWNLLFLSEILSLASSVVSLNVVSIVWAVVITLIFFYLLFQIKSSYR